MRTHHLWNFTTTWQQAKFEDIPLSDHVPSFHELFFVLTFKRTSAQKIARGNKAHNLVLKAKPEPVQSHDPGGWNQEGEHEGCRCTPNGPTATGIDKCWWVLNEKQIRLHLAESPKRTCLLQNTYQLHLLPSLMDGMSLVQKLNGNNKTFAHVA